VGVKYLSEKVEGEVGQVKKEEMVCDVCKNCKLTCVQYITFDKEECYHWQMRNLFKFRILKDFKDLI